MHIGIDARLLLGTVTGIGRYTFELSKRLSAMPDVQSSFYAPSPLAEGIIQSISSNKFRVGFSSNRLAKMIWAQTILPYMANKDAVDLFWGPTHRLPRVLNKTIARVVTIHDLVWSYVPETMRLTSLLVEKKLFPEAIGLADLIIVDSDSTAKGIADTFPQYAHKVRMVHLGVSKLLTREIDPLDLSGDFVKPYFLFVGTIEPRKNLERLLNAFSLLPGSIKDSFQLVIAGDKGWGGINIEKLIQNFGLKDSVQVLGYVEDEQLAKLYENARFLVMPSLYEGFGLPLVEAMQYGTPVLTSFEGSMFEVAGDAGVFIDPYSIESISLGLQTMLTDDGLIKNLGNNASRRAADFSWDKCAAETMKVFIEAMVLRDIRLSNFR